MSKSMITFAVYKNGICHYMLFSNEMPPFLNLHSPPIDLHQFSSLSISLYVLNSSLLVVVMNKKRVNTVNTLLANECMV